MWLFYEDFLYNLSGTIKDFFVLLVTDLCIGFHSLHGWELMIGFVYKDFGFTRNDQNSNSCFYFSGYSRYTNFKHWCGLSFQHKNNETHI